MAHGVYLSDIIAESDKFACHFKMAFLVMIPARLIL